jgi:hypothetical protein
MTGRLTTHDKPMASVWLSLVLRSMAKSAELMGGEGLGYIGQYPRSRPPK